MSGPTSRREEAFTLIELLIGIAILTVIVSALAGATIVGLRVQDQTVTAATRVIDEQFIGTYWNTDVQSAMSLTTTQRCAPPADLSTPVAIVSMSFRSESEGHAATWYSHEATDPGGATTLHLARVGCEGAPGSAATSRFSLASPLSVPPQLACEVLELGSLAARPWTTCASLPIHEIRRLVLTTTTTAAPETITERTTAYAATRRAG